MEVKKTPKADLQNKKGIFLEIGLCVSLLLMILLFRMNQKEVTVQDMGGIYEIIESEMAEITFEEQKPPEVKQTQVQTTAEILNIVRDDKKIDASISFSDFDQDIDIIFEPVQSKMEDVVADDTPLLKVDKMPTFQGGDQNAFRTWIMQRLANS